MDSWSGWPDLNRRPLRPEANARGAYHHSYFLLSLTRFDDIQHQWLTVWLHAVRKTDKNGPGAMLRGRFRW